MAGIRRAIDIFGALTGLVLLTPVMALIAAAIKADSRGPAVFRQTRVGRGGGRFAFYKFRTMRVNVDPYGFSPRDAADPRVTRVGRLLRKYSLDELPQLVNVLQGEMTLVGPRPLLPWQYDRWTARQRRRCEVKPGLTGWAQVHGRAALTHEEKIALDVWYVDHASFALDAKIVFKTIVQAIRAENTLEVRYSGAESDDE